MLYILGFAFPNALVTIKEPRFPNALVKTRIWGLREQRHNAASDRWAYHWSFTAEWGGIVSVLYAVYNDTPPTPNTTIPFQGHCTP